MPKTKGGVCKHGGYSLMVRRGKLPDKKMWRIRKYLTEVRAGLVRDVAGREEDLSTAQVVLIDRAVSLLSVIRTIEFSLSQDGIMQGQGKDIQLQSILRENYLAYSNSLRLILRELGIDKKRSDDVLDLTEYIKQSDEEKAKKAAERGIESAKGKGDGKDGRDL